MDEDFLICEDDRCVLLAEDFLEEVSKETKADRFNRVINDLAKVYPDAVLVGAVAAAKYVRNPERPRETEDIDVLLGEKDFAEFLIDDIPEEKLKTLEAYFDTSDSLSHSLRHKETGIYVDLLSTESNPIRKRITRHIFENRDRSTHILIGGNHSMDILKPELLLAMKINRFSKNPESQKGRSDLLDMKKILRTLMEKGIAVDFKLVESFLNENEIKKLKDIVQEVTSQHGTARAEKAGTGGPIN